MYGNVGGYRLSDIELTAVFNIVDTKAGIDLSEGNIHIPKKMPIRNYWG